MDRPRADRGEGLMKAIAGLGIGARIAVTPMPRSQEAEGETFRVRAFVSIRCTMSGSSQTPVPIRIAESRIALAGANIGASTGAPIVRALRPIWPEAARRQAATGPHWRDRRETRPTAWPGP